MGDSFSVFIVCCPDSYFVSFSSDIDHSTTNVITVVIKGLPDQAQQLKVRSTTSIKINHRQYKSLKQRTIQLKTP